MIDTKNSRRRLVQKKALTMPYTFYEENIHQTWFPSDEFDPNKILVITYAQFGVWEHHNPGFHAFFAVIICDEVRNKENAKASDKKVGRPKLTKEDIPAVFYKHYPTYATGKMNVSELARVFGLSRPTVYKYLKLVR